MLNKRMYELAQQAGLTEGRFERYKGEDCDLKGYCFLQDQLDKFFELLVQECIEQAHSVAELRGVNDDMIYGADTAAVRISKHFGVEE